ncbi:MAG: hypothetical protein KDA45_14135, partial [Planctomycetales bacterium]|nr:hypothetical protein [Planctomycetales bacterium]
MQRTDTCCAQLEQQFNEARGSNDQRCNVIHADISGYGTAQELLLRNHYDLPLLPDAILLAVFPENDIRHHSRLQSADEPQPYFTLDDNNELRLDTGFRQSTVWLTAATTRRRVTRYSVRRSRLLQPFKRAKLRLWYLPVQPPI